MRRSASRLCFLLLALLLAATQADAATGGLVGTVRDSRQTAVGGALVTLTHRGHQRSTTVYTDTEALNVDRRTDTVWICGTNSDTLIRFEPDVERFTVYPLPTRVTYTREIDFDDAGGVWASNSNFPTWQIEAPGPKVIRLVPGA